MKHYVVKYELPYTHIVMVGVIAENEQAACAAVSGAFDSGDIWNDTPEMPMLHDSYEENLDSGVAMVFKATEAPLPLDVLRRETMQLQVNEYRNDNLDIADDAWTTEDL